MASSSEYDGEKEVKVRSLFLVRAMLPFMVDSHIFFPFLLLNLVRFTSFSDDSGEFHGGAGHHSGLQDSTEA